MLKSLYSGVSGLQSHQVAMDVESNNIANVNTVGYKYSRANFSDLLAQTKAIATAPQGNLGGKNAVQVGLGSTVSSTTRIFSQGSVQNTDKNTDLAIQGDGFFMISPDGGNTYQYTRAGDFKFDADGNFVDNNGFVVQGWLRDDVTGKVDSTAPITNINIAPGLTTPANPSAEVVIKANLNSGSLIESFSPSFEVASGIPPSIAIPGSPDAIDAAGNPIESGDMGVMFNDSGEALNLQTGQGVWISFLSATKNDAPSNSIAAGAGELDITFTLDDGSTQQITTTGGLATNSIAQNGNRYAAAINAQSAVTGIIASYDAVNEKINLTNTNESSSSSHNIRLTTKGAGDNSGLIIGTATTAYTYTYDPTGSNPTVDMNKTFTSIADLRYAMEQQARAYNEVNAGIATSAVTQGDGTNEGVDFTINGIAVSVADGGADVAQVEQTVLDADLVDGDTISVTINGNTYSSTFDSANPALDSHDEVMTAFASAIDSGEAGITVTFDTPRTITATADVAGTPFTLDTDYAVASTGAGTAIAGAGTDVANNTLRTQDQNGVIYANAINAQNISGITASYDATTDKLTINNTNASSVDLVVTSGDSGQTGFAAGTTVIAAATIGDGDAITNENNIEISINDEGKFKIKNPGGSDDGDYDMNLKITSYASTINNILENSEFTRSLEAMNTVLEAGSTGIAFSQSFNAATHSSSIDIFDSLGSKHTLTTNFRKTSVDSTTGSTWDITISVPPPAEISTVTPYNEITGSIRFNNDGSLATYSPSSISFSGNNGSAPNQQIALSFGSSNAFNGMTSFDSKSTTSGISQDGYTGGDLVGIRIDQSGTLVGSFSNGRSFGLAQVGMAKFTNNEGLSVEGGNVYNQTANSGEPIIGTAATAGRGFIQASALEASNVDLSSALTQLIVIQRGYQANGKTITTSDTLLETLIGLKR